MKLSKLSKNILAAKISAVLVIGIGGVGMIKPTPSYAGIPVIDVTGLTQHIVSAIQNVQQTLQVIQSYQTQIQQFQNQIINTIQPAVFLWDDANNVVNNLLNKVDTITDLSNQFGSIDNYLDRFKDINTYRNAPCLANGCTRNQMANWLRDQIDLKVDKSAELRETNRAVIRGIEDQQEQMMNDAQALRQLQQRTQGSQGQMQALQSANQLASTQANQLLQIRGLLISQQNAVAASQLLDADREALEEAATQKNRSTRAIQPSPQVNW